MVWCLSWQRSSLHRNVKYERSFVRLCSLSCGLMCCRSSEWLKDGQSWWWSKPPRDPSTFGQVAGRSTRDLERACLQRWGLPLVQFRMRHAKQSHQIGNFAMKYRMAHDHCPQAPKRRDSTRCPVSLLLVHRVISSEAGYVWRLEEHQK